MAEHVLTSGKPSFSAPPVRPAEKPHFIFHLKDPGSAITHLIALIAAVLATPLLLVHCAGLGADTVQLGSLSVFMLSMIALYAASTTYHSLDLPGKRNLILKKMDHMMIFVLIAGTYTPMCTITLAGAGGKTLLILVWSVAAAGILLKLLWVTHPKWISSVLYIGMGWLCIMDLPALLQRLSPAGFRWLLAGGLFYTVGGVLYALRLKKLNELWPNFGSHEIFHLFVMAGSFCHFMVMYNHLF